MKRRVLSETPKVAQQNIEAIAQLERDLLNARTLSQRIADSIADFAGSIRFAVLHLIGFALWVVMNTGRIPGLLPFDPYPYILLSLVVSCEAVLLSTFVLIKQNRMSRRSPRYCRYNS